MPTTVSDLWFVAHDNCSVNIRAPLFSSCQIDHEVHRANMEHRDGRTDWVAVELEEVILVYGEKSAANALDRLMRDLGQTRH
jgi:hypothetical protein